MDIEIQKITGKPSGDKIGLTAGESIVVQMPYEFIESLSHAAHLAGAHIIEAEIPHYKRLNFKTHIEYLKRWHGSSLKTMNLMKQFMIHDGSIPLSKLNKSEIQKLGYVHALLSDRKHIVFIDPFLNTVNDNIHLFHKMKEQLIIQGKSLLIVTSRLEDAFIAQPDVMKLNEQGLQIVETTDNTIEDSATSKIKVKAHDKTIFVTIADIEYLESQDGKVYINIGHEKFVMESTLQNAEDMLDQHGFYRCHRSYLVNLHKVKEIITWSKNTYSVIINNQHGSKIPLSRAKFNEIQEKLIKL